MSDLTKDEALTFVEAIRLTLNGKVGFKWLVLKLSNLSDYIESVSTENEQLKAFLDATGARQDFEWYRSQQPEPRDETTARAQDADQTKSDTVP